MESAADRHQIALEAKAIVALAFRNGPIENVHAGRECPTCAGRDEYSGITDDEMKAIMKSAVNRMYKLLVLKAENPEEYDRQIHFGARYTTRWDEPKVPSANESGVDFVVADLNIALTFLDVADTSGEIETKERNRRNARKAYDTVAGLLPMLSPNSEQLSQIDLGLQTLKKRLIDAGERF